MAKYLIDYENPGGQAFFNYMKKRPLNEDDRIFLFYSDNQKPAEQVLKLCFDKFKYSPHGVKNGLDFLLVTYLGSIIADDGFPNDYGFYIVSKDKGFGEVIRFWQERWDGVRFGQITSENDFIYTQLNEELHKVQIFDFFFKANTELDRNENLNRRYKAVSIMERIYSLVFSQTNEDKLFDRIYDVTKSKSRTAEIVKRLRPVFEKIRKEVPVVDHRIFDITQPLFESNLYPDGLGPQWERVRTIAEDGYNLTNISLCVHNGTHIDAPMHFLKNGVGVNKLPLDVFCGNCFVKEWDGQIPQNCERLLIKGGYILTTDDANLLVKSGVRLVGVEQQSVGDPAAPAEVHKILLSAGIVPLEGIVLGDVPDDEYTLSAFPLNLGKCDGSPVRAVLIK